ncbi:aldehyde dehydrogenase [uncultured Clostridium sp.]|jgi:aldehyde dehydrogenase (NAD+)|uniref:aldehyde dehydrogenase n=1 Tax=uncultured Clostridium sp. TaxID=59620 RepID=UPI00261C3947|nr:aldehyde dehydrogenase [uncultured Clostridium sp.]
MSFDKEVFEKQKSFFKSGRTLDVDFRIKQLKRLKEVIKAKEEKILEALNTDLRKSRFEGYITEVSMVYEEINLSIRNLKSWSRNKKVKSPITVFPASSYIHYEPFGTVLIIGPFNYPFQLNLSPLIGAISAGNTAMVRPSEATIATSEIIKDIIEEAFDLKYVAYIDPRNGREVMKEILAFNYDYIFFTGSIKVGKIVMSAAAENLTPVTLELGGKSPCIVDEDAKVRLAARRIVWGKLLNCGQTCVAPDYIYVHKKIKEEFLVALKEEIKLQYGDDVQKSPDYVRMVNEREFDRVLSYIDNEKVWFGGASDREDLYIEPTILNGVSVDDKVMEGEIFGPIIPVLEFEDISRVIDEINSNEKPLALYYFSQDKRKRNHILKYTTAGGVTLNDTVIHVASPYLPFGGVGTSGMGQYHGEESFLTFSNKKAILDRATWLDMPLRYAPFKNKLSWVKKIL